ncbi:MAG TPA: CRISPR-associated endonuclease Cas2 [Alicycliphilus sp.]|nr:CRISPR-associated endonuclease Cas2 [Alicycliphilus sp.]
MPRTLYLVAYDVCNPKRLAKVGRYFHSYRVAGQKSVPEIWVTPAELARIQTDMDHMLQKDEDRLQLIALDPRMTPRCMGQAESFKATHFCIT